MGTAISSRVSCIGFCIFASPQHPGERGDVVALVSVVLYFHLQFDLFWESLFPEPFPYRCFFFQWRCNRMVWTPRWTSVRDAGLFAWSWAPYASIRKTMAGCGFMFGGSYCCKSNYRFAVLRCLRRSAD